MVLSILFTMIMGFIFFCSGIYMLGIWIYYEIKPKSDSPNDEKPKKYIIVEAEETEEERQCREYGDCYGYSYYW